MKISGEIYSRDYCKIFNWDHVFTGGESLQPTRKGYLMSFKEFSSAHSLPAKDKPDEASKDTPAGSQPSSKSSEGVVTKSNGQPPVR